jgi:hypothetical protein
MPATAKNFKRVLPGLKLTLGGEAVKRLCHLCGFNFIYAAAVLADEESDKILRAMVMRAGNERVTAGEAVDEPVFQQKIQSAIDGDRREAFLGSVSVFCYLLFGAHPVGYVIGAQRLMRSEQGL